MPRPKGIARSITQDTETTPLLPSTSDTQIDNDHVSRRQTGRALPVVYTALIVAASALLAFALFLTLLLSSFRPTSSEIAALPSRAVLYQLPESIDVLNVSDSGILVNITLRCGIDADQALGVQHRTGVERARAYAQGDRGGGAAWWEQLRRWTARRIFGQLPSSAVLVTIPHEVHITSEKGRSSPLASVTLVDRLAIPLVSDVPSPLPAEWLPVTSFVALTKPMAASGDIWQFIQNSWIDSQVHVRLEVDRAEAALPDGPWWTKYAKMDKEDIQFSVNLPVPDINGLPSPGNPLNLSSLIALQRYKFETQSSPHALSIAAHATVPNFAPQVNFSIPFPLPFSILLPGTEDRNLDGEQMALVVTKPTELRSGSEAIAIAMSGIVTANFSSPNNGTSSLSLFIQNYLHGKDSPISVRGLGALPDFVPPGPTPPAWLLASLSSLDLPWAFPGPRPRPKVIQSVTIEHMRISESAGKMKASGTVVAQVELPREMQTIALEVVEVLPDVLVYDGPAPEEDAGEDPDEPSARAFGHINPPDFLSSTTSPSGDPQYPHRLVVTAPLSNVDLEVLPGRDGVLSDFVSKVIFKGGAQAGVKGTASVIVVISGVQGRVRLDNLPVRGDFWVGRQR